MKKKITLSSALSYMFIAMTVTFCLTMVLSSRMFEAKVQSVSEKESMYDKISDIDAVVRQNYYTEIHDSNIYENLSRGYVNGLADRESRYLTVEEVNDYQQEFTGKVIGIGMEFTKSREDSGYMKVYDVYSESPADVQGIVPGDLIVSINGTGTINMSQQEAVKMMTGVSGDTMDIVYMHDGTENTATLTFKAYDAPSVTYSKEGDAGYIKVNNFSSRTASELEYAVNNLSGQEVKGLVIDVRDNSSRDFDSAAAAADILLGEGTTMYANYKGGERKVLYTSDKTSTNLPISVIANGGTGYAAEMFAVMVRDSAGGKVVGTTTMGKGTLQKLFRLPDGSGVVLTVAELSPNSTPVYTNTGIIPDYEKALDAGQSVHDLTISTDPQIIRAIEVVNNLSAQ